MKPDTSRKYGQSVKWEPSTPKLKFSRLLIVWFLSALAIDISATILPGVALDNLLVALYAIILISLINAILPPLFASLKLPYMLIVGFVVILLLDTYALLWAANLSENKLYFKSFNWALLTALASAAISMIFEEIFGINEHDNYNLKVTARIAKRIKNRDKTDKPGIIFLEIDGLAYPILKKALRDGFVPNMARLIKIGSHNLTEWETDLSSQTGASQSAILLGSNNDIPSFRWIEKETGRVMTCSAPADCAEIERRHLVDGLLANGGTSRSNLLSGDAEEALLTPSRMEAEKRANPGYRSFFSNGFNITRTIVLFIRELVIEWQCALKDKRHNILPRGYRGGKYPFVRAGLCVVVRDIIVQTIITDVLKGRPAIYATFAGYDEVAHHSGLERPDTLEVLRNIDDQFGKIMHATKYAPRSYKIIFLSDHGQTQGATFKQRNGFSLEELVKKGIKNTSVTHYLGGDENDTALYKALNEAVGRRGKNVKFETNNSKVAVLGSGNLGLIYLLDKKTRYTLEEIEQKYPKLFRTLLNNKNLGWIMVNSNKQGPVVLSKTGKLYLKNRRLEGQNPLKNFSPNAPQHLLRTNDFKHTADITVNSFYDPENDEGCAFEDLISFHGGMGGSQTRPFLLYPSDMKLQSKFIIGAESLHTQLKFWREQLQK